MRLYSIAIVLWTATVTARAVLIATENSTGKDEVSLKPENHSFNDQVGPYIGGQTYGVLIQRRSRDRSKATNETGEPTEKRNSTDKVQVRKPEPEASGSFLNPRSYLPNEANSLQSFRFSRPIVVPDIQNKQKPEDLNPLSTNENPANRSTEQSGYVEIQKSIEIHHTAPIQEIHYPVEYIQIKHQDTSNSLRQNYSKPSDPPRNAILEENEIPRAENIRFRSSAAIDKLVARPTQVEKVIERKVPYPVEKVIEKQITLPQFFPIYIRVPVERIIEKQIRVPQPYPVPVERKVPYIMPRFILRPYPVPFTVPFIEKPMILQEKKLYPAETQKFQKSLLQPTKRFNQRVFPEEQKEASSTTHLEIEEMRPSKMFGHRNLHVPPFYRVKDEYIGPVPPPETPGIRGKSRGMTSVTQTPMTTLSAMTVLTTSSRKTRQPEGNAPGSFRQSKMEYGFKPPMVPSVRYDETTGTKIDD